MICKLCEKDRPLIEAHIVPLCITRALLDPSGPMKLLSKEADIYPIKFPKGEYDKNILCGDCDGGFAGWEEYARDLLFDNFDSKYPRIVSSTASDLVPGHFSIPKFDYGALKLFFLSLLWRAGVSNRISCRHVNLGPYEPKIRNMLRSGMPGAPEEFPVHISRYVDEEGRGTMFSPHRQKTLGVNFYNVFLPGYLAVIKVDAKALPTPLRALYLEPGKPLIIAARDLRFSPEYKPFREIILKNSQ